MKAYNIGFPFFKGRIWACDRGQANQGFLPNWTQLGSEWKNQEGAAQFSQHAELIEMGLEVLTVNSVTLKRVSGENDVTMEQRQETVLLV